MTARKQPAHTEIARQLCCADGRHYTIVPGEEAHMFSRIPSVAKYLLFPLALAAGANASAQDDCPPWAQTKLKQLQERGAQAAMQAAQGGNIGVYMNTLQEITAEGSTLLPACLPQPVAGPGNDAIDRMQCQSRWDDYHRCDFNFRKKLAAGQNPAHMCFRPTCVR